MPKNVAQFLSRIQVVVHEVRLRKGSVQVIAYAKQGPGVDTGELMLALTDLQSLPYYPGQELEVTLKPKGAP
jgi:hypothetical protein